MKNSIGLPEGWQYTTVMDEFRIYNLERQGHTCIVRTELPQKWYYCQKEKCGGIFTSRLNQIIEQNSDG